MNHLLLGEVPTNQKRISQSVFSECYWQTVGRASERKAHSSSVRKRATTTSTLSPRCPLPYVLVNYQNSSEGERVGVTRKELLRESVLTHELKNNRTLTNK